MHSRSLLAPKPEVAAEPFIEQEKRGKRNLQQGRRREKKKNNMSHHGAGEAANSQMCQKLQEMMTIINGLYQKQGM